MLASTGQPVGNPAAWSWELKFDDWRALVYVDDGLKVRTRTGREGYRLTIRSSLGVRASPPSLGQIPDGRWGFRRSDFAGYPAKIPRATCASTCATPTARSLVSRRLPSCAVGQSRSGARA
jgi:hypothetical protein